MDIKEYIKNKISTLKTTRDACIILTAIFGIFTIFGLIAFVAEPYSGGGIVLLITLILPVGFIFGATVAHKNMNEAIQKYNAILDREAKTSEPTEEEKAEKTEIPCLICGEDAGEYHFCHSCFNKYKDHDIIIRISKCKEATVEERYAEGQRYVCKDGHIVRSKSERDIDNYLFDNRIFHVYEKKFDVDGEDTIKPDFYLPQKDIYIEHWGLDSEKYQKEKQYKLNVYRKHNVTVICTYEDDMDDFEFNIKRKLNNFKYNEINYLK